MQKPIKKRRTMAADGATTARAVATLVIPERQSVPARTEAASAVAGRNQAVVSDPSLDGIRLGFLIHDVSRMRSHAFDHFMKPLGVSRGQWWVLAHLSRHDGMTQSRLAELLETGRASLGDVIMGLESRGYVERRPDPSDRRGKRVYLTKVAQSLIRRMTVLERHFNEQILIDLCPTERTALIQCLQKIKRVVVRYCPAQGIQG
jgi:DNA-binding MarR family transcriptional regulator